MQRLENGAERKGLTDGVAMADQLESLVKGRMAEQLENQPALADTSLAFHHHQGRGTRRGSGHGMQLRLPSHQKR